MDEGRSPDTRRAFVIQAIPRRPFEGAFMQAMGKQMLGEEN
jgi:hypothetical protein